MKNKIEEEETSNEITIKMLKQQNIALCSRLDILKKEKNELVSNNK